MDPDEEVLRAHFDASNRGDYARAGADYDEHVVLVGSIGVPESDVRYGWRDVNRWFADWMATFAGGVWFDELEIERGRNGLAATARHIARGRKSGAEITAQHAWAYWFRKGKIVRVEIYKSMAEARAAAGVEADPGGEPSPMA
jgi:ketosteroid isomerase-like protein